MTVARAGPEDRRPRAWPLPSPEPAKAELHQPPAQGQAARLGRTGEGQGKQTTKTPDRDDAAVASALGFIDRATTSYELQRKDPRRWPPSTPNRWKPAPRSFARPTNG